MLEALAENDAGSWWKSRIGGLDPCVDKSARAFEIEAHDFAQGIAASIAANASGRRDQLEPVAELDGAGNLVARFVYATKSHSPDYMVRDGRTYRILSDHLGSPRLVIDVDSGAVVQEMRFDEWGVVTLDTNPGWQPFGFAGGLLDADTGLTRFGARDYAAAEGRWTAKDAVFAPNVFQYASNDPVNLIDPSGLTGLDPAAAERTADAILRCGTQAGPVLTPIIATSPVWAPYVAPAAGIVAAPVAGYLVGYYVVGEWLYPTPASGPPQCSPGDPSSCPSKANENETEETETCRVKASKVYALCFQRLVRDTDLPLDGIMILCLDEARKTFGACVDENPPTIH